MKHFQMLALSSLFVFSCAMNAPTASAESNDFTLGKVQSQLSEGMSSSQVVNLLGSPNLVTSTQGGGEAWTYDKVCLLYTSPSPRDRTRSRMPSSA